LRVKEITNAERDNYGYANNLLGPLTIQAITELLYRVEEVDFSGTIVINAFATNIAMPLSGTMLPVYGWDEREKFEHHSQNPGEDVSFDHYYERYYGNPGDGQESELRPLSDSPLRPDLPEAEIYKDEDGNFWLHGYFGFFRHDGITPSWIFGLPVSSGSALPGTGETVVQFTIPLTLSGVVHNLAASVILYSGESFVSCDIAMIPTKWHAYKTTAGAPAWDTATGAPANGGPGA
jgi:hypothetical protein